MAEIINEVTDCLASHIYRFTWAKYNLQRGLVPQIEQFYKEDGEYVKKGETIFIWRYLITSTLRKINERLKLDISNAQYDSELVLEKADRDGYLDIPFPTEEPMYYLLGDDTIQYFIHSTDQDRINRKFANVPIISVDPFTKRKSIKWEQLSGSVRFIESLSLDKKIALEFSFNHIDSRDYIVFETDPGQLVLSKDDTISFLFENEQIIEFKLIDEPYRVLYPKQKNQIKILITDNELTIFQNANFKFWKINLNRKKHSIIGGDIGYFYYYSKKNLITVIKKLATEYRALVRKEVENYQPFYDQTRSIEGKSSVSEECHVYLMVDFTNNHYKIGMSNNPDFREKTLQSEKPTIEMIAAKKFINRKIASSFEKALHNTYSEKRIRGEWFQLDAIEVNEIKITLQN